MSHPGGYVGVDVVDLEDRRCAGKHEDRRFLARILSPAELEAISTTSDAFATLWRIWAAKEAAFKVVSKLEGAPPPFVHAEFEVEDAQTETGFGRVVWRGAVIHTHWHALPGRTVALGWDGLASDEAVEWGWGAMSVLDPAPHASMEELLARLTERERGPVHSRGSALVRLAARAALAAALNVEEARVQIVSSDGPKGRVPPEVLLDGEPAQADVSLSHHGRWLAWGLRLAERAARQPSAAS